MPGGLPGGFCFRAAFWYGRVTQAAHRDKSQQEELQERSPRLTGGCVRKAVLERGRKAQSKEQEETWEHGRALLLEKAPSLGASVSPASLFAVGVALGRLGCAGHLQLGEGLEGDEVQRGSPSSQGACSAGGGGTGTPGQAAQRHEVFELLYTRLLPSPLPLPACWS